MTYCIYTDTEVPDDLGNYDHIVPLSLGGSNSFQVWSSAAFNSTMGTQIDGKIANDPLIMLARRNADARGHSKVSPIPIWKKSNLGGKPVQVSLGHDRIEVWDAVARRNLSEQEVTDQSIETTLKIDKVSPLKFAAKIALAGGYSVYGKSFQENFDCGQLRRLITMDMTDRYAPEWENTAAKVMDRWHKDVAPAGNERWPGLSEQGSAMVKWIVCRVPCLANTGPHGGRA